MSQYPGRHFRAHLALLGASLIYGATFTIAKGILPAWMTPMALVVLRTATALSLFVLAGMYYKRERFSVRDFAAMALCGLFGVALNQSLFLTGLSLTREIHASLIMITSPITVVVIAAIIIKERISARRLLGILLGCAGAAFLILYGNRLMITSDTLKGDLLVYANATSYSIYLVLARPLMQKYKPVLVISWIFFFGFVLVLPFGYRDFAAVDWSSMPPRIIVSVIYVAVFTTFMAYLLNVYALKHISPSVVSFYIYLQPLFATLIALGLGKDELTPDKLVAAALIFAGVWLVNMPRR